MFNTRYYFFTIFLEIFRSTEDIILEPKYFSCEKSCFEKSPDMVVNTDTLKYSVEVKINKKLARKKAPYQIQKSFIYDNCDFGLCLFPRKNISKIKHLKNISSYCFITEEEYTKLEDIGLKKTKERSKIVLIDYPNIKEFFENMIS